MTDYEMTRADLSDLADRLDGIHPPLSDREKVLVSALVKATADRYAGDASPTLQVDDPRPDFHEQFAKSFTGGTGDAVLKINKISKA
jgi:hypothetical protein